MLILKANTFHRALIEAVVVAVGVFFALAADNWNDTRKERQLEQDFLAGIALDLQLNIERIQNVRSTSTELKIALERVVHALNTGESGWDTPEDFVQDLVLCTYLGIPTLSSVTYDELQSTGSMRLIQNREFKRKLAEYYARFLQSSQFHSEYRRKEAAIEEVLLGFLPLQDRMEVSEERQILATSVDPEQWLDRLREIPDVVARLEDMVWVQYRILTRYNWIVDTGEELLADIDSMQP